MVHKFQENLMGFMKFGVGVSKATLVVKDTLGSPTTGIPAPALGQEQDGRVWDGSSWITKEDWESRVDERKP